MLAELLLTVVITLCAALPSIVVDYKKTWTSRGDRLPDFSFAGYRQSEVALPATDRPSTLTISPGLGDQAPVIQAALNQVTQLGGGIVDLAAGNYTLSSGLIIRNGTTLRGAGIGNTILTVSSLYQPVVTMGQPDLKEQRGKATNITDPYVPAGTNLVNVLDTSRLFAGKDVYVERGVTQAWIDAMGMTAQKKADGAPRDFTWLDPGKLVQQPRRVKSISGKTIGLDIPLTDSLDATNGIMSPIQLTPYMPPAQPSEMGIENLSMRVEPSCSGKSLNDLSCASSAIRFSPWATNAWARNLDLTGFNHGIDIMRSASRITITSVVMNRYGPTDSSAGYAIDVAIDGTQVLVHNVKNRGDGKSWSVATESLTPGPNVCIGYESQQPIENIGIEPHQRWAHGFLNEGSRVVSVVYRNRGNAGTGHGWTMNNGVSWNSNSTSVTMQDPPLGQNFCFGCVGANSGKVGYETNSTGIYGAFVDPPSLFQAQLADRGFSFSLGNVVLQRREENCGL